MKIATMGFAENHPGGGKESEHSYNAPRPPIFNFKLRIKA